MSFVEGASSSLRKNIKRMKRLITEDIGTSPSPRLDYNIHLNALIKKAYSEGFKKAHIVLHEKFRDDGSFPIEVKHPAKTPASKGKQKFKISSKIKED